MARTWLITGASRGFGRSLAEAVLDSGDQVLVTARRPEQLADLVSRYGARVRSAVCAAPSTREPETKSAVPATTGPTTRSRSAASYWPSASVVAM